MGKTMDLIDINEAKGFPRKYRFNQFIRWFVIVFGIAATIYAFWTIFERIDADSSKVIKIAPFVIIFFAFNAVLRNLFSINVITFTESDLIFSFILKKKVIIPWSSIKSMSYGIGRQRSVVIEYDKDGELTKFSMLLGFPRMLEILNSIAEMCPDIEYDDFLEKIIISRVIKKSKIDKDTK